jgi:hypothetical protein
MIPLFLGLTAFNLLALSVATTLGYGVSFGRNWASYHQLAGALAAIACCGVHCVVFTYFIATAKWIQHAVTVKKLDPALATADTLVQGPGVSRRATGDDDRLRHRANRRDHVQLSHRAGMAPRPGDRIARCQPDRCRD